MATKKIGIQQRVFTILCNNNLKCSCDESYDEDSLFQARGHYHHCRLWEVTEALRLYQKYLKQEFDKKIMEWGIEQGGDKLHFKQLIDEVLSDEY